MPARRRPSSSTAAPRRWACVALSAALGTAAVELARVWRRGSAELPTETEDVSELLEAAGTATLETIAVVREGYKAVSTRENAVFNLLAAFTVTFGLTRATTALIRSGKGHGVLRDFVIADKRVHHFVPGIALALAAGGTSISVRSKQLDRWLALPFGAGAALVLDEAALLLELDDVYWTEEGVLSLQVSFGGDRHARGRRAGRAAAAPGRDLGRHHASASIVIPATTTTAPAIRWRPAGSPSTSAANAVANTTLVSRSAATGAAGARSSAASTSA